MSERFVLPDVLEPDLSVVFCGTAAGRVSADLQAYYAHPQNTFWRVLYETQLTPVLLRPHEFRRLLEFKIGLTDLCKDDRGNDDQVRVITKADAAILEEKLRQYRPRFLAFTSKKSGRLFCGNRAELGEQTEFRVEDTRIFILPSTSPSARWQWPKTSLRWDAFAKEVRRVG